MAEYIYNPVQIVAPRGTVIFDDSIPCTRGLVYHRDGSGIFTLKGRTNQCFARYRVTFNANIGIPEAESIGAIAVALALNGEPILSSRAIVTPESTVPATYFNVTSTAIIDIPRGCCDTLSVENVSALNDGTAPIPISVQNANIVIDRIA